MHESFYLEIEQKGYTRIPKLFNKDIVSQLKQMILNEWDKLSKSQLLNKDIPGLNQGHQMIYNLQNKDIYFYQVFMREPLLRTLLMKCLNDEWYKQIPQGNPNFILRSLLARSSGPASMPLHIDSFIPNTGNHIPLIQVALVLENQTLENGCTMAVPGSHKFGRYATQDWLKYTVPIESEAGDLVIWDSRLWHGAGGNSTAGSRWSIVGTFSRWWIKQNYNITGAIPPAFLQKLTLEEKSVLGFCSLPPHDEYDRMDIKAGYSILEKQTAIETQE